MTCSRAISARPSSSGATRVAPPPAQGQVNGVRIGNAVLFGLFRDQRNIVRVLHTPSDTRRTLYFAAPDDEPQSIAFD